MKQGEPKSTDFLLNETTPICNSEQTTVRSDEARQESQADGSYYNKLKRFAKDLRNNPTLAENILKEVKNG